MVLLASKNLPVVQKSTRPYG